MARLIDLAWKILALLAIVACIVATMSILVLLVVGVWNLIMWAP